MKVLHVDIIRELQRMYAHYRKPLDEDELLLWSRHLDGYSIDDVVAAISDAIRRSEGFCPVIGNVLAALGERRALVGADAGPYAAMWTSTLATIMDEGGLAAQFRIGRMDESAKRAMVNRLAQWIEDCCGEDWTSLMREIERRTQERTDGEVRYYFYAVLDDLPWIVMSMKERNLIN